MHFCVSDHVSEWLSQIVLDKVHLRREITESQPPGEIRATENETPMLEAATRREQHLRVPVLEYFHISLTMLCHALQY